MSFLLKGLLAIFWLLLIPAAAGSLVWYKRKEMTLSGSFLTGYVLMFALFEVIALPMLFFKLSLRTLTVTYGCILFLAGAAGGVRTGKKFIPGISWLKEKIKGRSIYFWVAVLLIALQIVVVVLFAHMDADDAFYVGTATTAQYTDTIFEYNAYTGAAYEVLPRRYALSPFPAFLAVVSELVGGLHAAITAHVVFPPVFFLVAYLVYYKIGGILFQKDRRQQEIFLFSAGVLNCFTAYSIYTSSTFMMVRIWQGKGFFAAAMLPLLFYICWRAFLERDTGYAFWMAAAVCLACCLLSSMAIMLSPLVICILAVLGSVRQRSLIDLIKGVLCCLPAVVLGAMYLLAW